MSWVEVGARFYNTIKWIYITILLTHLLTYLIPLNITLQSYVLFIFHIQININCKKVLWLPIFSQFTPLNVPKIVAFVQKCTCPDFKPGASLNEYFTLSPFCIGSLTKCVCHFTDTFWLILVSLRSLK